MKLEFIQSYFKRMNYSLTNTFYLVFIEQISSLLQNKIKLVLKCVQLLEKALKTVLWVQVMGFRLYFATGFHKCYDTSNR